MRLCCAGCTPLTGRPPAFGPPAQGLGAFFDSPVFGQFRLMAENLAANTDVAWLWADGTVLWLVVITGAAAVVTSLAGRSSGGCC